ncbi:Nucleoporin [Zalerion maritima]|uniref:Nucleoporin n=1 Tax=Zalerion maritima TaxID=339359 RepID=A0AAD5RQG7_9PEZI|nr:Nucleoporin [Zalerion maritima]
MAFSQPKLGGALAPLQGDGLARIEAETLGFRGVNGDAQVRLTSKWDPLPPQTASLLAIAHRSGWLAAAGPDSFVLAKTKAIRDAFKADPESADSKIRPFTPHIKIDVPGRITHVAFTSDEKYLIVSSEPRGALNIFDSQSLFNGSSRQPSFELATNGEPLRALVPNPAIEKAELIAAVTTQGNLLVANMKTRSFEGNGGVLRTNASCVAWSTRGKQLVAGTAEGFVFQMTPSGEVKAELPRALDLQGDFFVDTLSWLENDLFFAAYVSTGEEKSSEYRLITRDSSGVKFQAAEDMGFPSDVSRVPHSSVARLKDFPPAIQDILIVSSSVSPDISVISRARTPLASDNRGIVNIFATCPPRDDSRRACVPQNDEWEDTWVVGASLDLSSTEKVYKPLPDDEELEFSPGPVPAYWVLNHEGIIVGWWVIYDDSIREGTTYSGMASLGAAASTPASPAAARQQPPATKNGFGGTSNTASPFGAPSNGASPFGPSTSASPFGGSPGHKAAFGASSGLGQSSSPWGASTTANKPSSPFGGTPGGQSGFGSAAAGGSPFGQASSPGGAAALAFGQTSTLAKPAALGQTSSLGAPKAPAFGQTSTLGGNAFDQSGGLGANESPWAASSSASTSAFGQTGFGATAQTKDASKPAAPSSGGFASFANAGGFSSLVPSSGSAGSAIQSIFAQGNPGASFKSDVSMSSSFGGAANKPSPLGTSPFAASSSGLSSESFKLGTTFKRDPNDNDVDEMPQDRGGLFGSAFGSALGATAADASAEEVDMDAGGSTPKTSSANMAVEESTTPTTTPAPPKFSIAPAPTSTPSTSLFRGSEASQSSTILFGSSKSDGMPAQQPSSKGIFDRSTPTQPSSTPFGSNKDGKPPATTSIFGEPTTEKKDQSSSLFPPPKPSGGLFSNSSKETKEANIFGVAKQSSPSLFSKPEVPTESTTPEKLKDSSESSTDTPLPPESTSKSTYPFGGSSSSSSASSVSTIAKPQPPTEENKLTQKDAEDAPLPPDFITKKKTPEIVSEDAPLPPDPTKLPKVLEPPLPPLPGLKPASKETSAPSLFTKPSLPTNASSVPSVPDSLDDDGFSEAGRESEGSGVDVARDLSPPGIVAKTPGLTPQSSFGGIGDSAFSSVSRPEQHSRLFGEMGRNAPILPKPPMFTSPRSPSPVRGVPAPIPGPPSITNLRNCEMRSVSAPGMASQILGNSRMRSQGPGAQPGFGASITGKAAPMPNLMEPHLKAKAKREAEEAQILIDENDDQIQKVLAAEIVPTQHLDEFIAHSNAGSSEKDQSVASQVEAVYRDINSMIDTIGLNARSLAAFVQGHSAPATDDGRGRQDLEDPDGWVLSEVEDLNDIVEVDLAENLEDGRVREAEAKKAACTDMLRDLNRLRARQDDLKKIIFAATDLDLIAVKRALPLSSEQSAQQAEIRKEYMAFSKTLAEVEEALVILKTKVATAAATSGKASLCGNVPTVDAIMRTIQRMTSMAEKRSGDIDVLETQMRKLRLGSLGPNSPRSREGSPLVGSPRKGRPGRSLVLRESVMSAGSARGTPRKKLSGFSDEEKRELMERRKSRKDVMDKVKKSLEKVGPRVIPLEE